MSISKTLTTLSFRLNWLIMILLLGTECGILVSVEVKRESEGFLTVHFSNIRHHLSDCTWINEPGVQQLNVNFARTVETIHKTIGDFQ